MKITIRPGKEQGLSIDISLKNDPDEVIYVDGHPITRGEYADIVEEQKALARQFGHDISGFQPHDPVTVELQEPT